jgi:PIN domain nuclease of toxin-antitoxin system
MTAGLLDTSVVICSPNKERGADAAKELMPTCTISLVNLAEVVTKLSDWDMMGDQVKAHLKTLGPARTDYIEDDALETGALRPLTPCAGPLARRPGLPGDGQAPACAGLHDRPAMSEA